MKHTTPEQLAQIAEVKPALALTRRERLERWAELLEREPSARLSTLDEIEFCPRAERPLMRAENSPLTVAYNDPLLRGVGLESDRLGDAMKFFALSEPEAHRVLCSCMHGVRVEARAAAHAVRAIANSWTVDTRSAIVCGVLALPIVWAATLLLAKMI